MQPLPPPQPYQQPPSGPPYYPPPTVYQQVYSPSPYQERPLRRDMKVMAILCFVFALPLQFLALTPLIGSLFGLFGLLLSLAGFIFLCCI